MFPKWFDKWNKENPTNIFGPAILIGALGGAVFVAILLVNFGQPYNTTSLQTGPRGTGMSVPEFSAQVIQPDPTIEDYYTEEPYVPEGGEELAKDIYENVQVLGELTEDNFNRLMLAMTQWSRRMMAVPIATVTWILRSTAKTIFIPKSSRAA